MSRTQFQAKRSSLESFRFFILKVSYLAEIDEQDFELYDESI